MFVRICVSSLLSFALALTLSTPAAADSLLPATATRTLLFSGPVPEPGSSVGGFGFYSGLGDYPGFGVQNTATITEPAANANASATTVGSSSPSVLTRVIASGSFLANNTLSSEASITYYMEVTGPGGEMVPITFQSTASDFIIAASSAASVTAESSLTLSSTVDNSVLLSAAACAANASVGLANCAPANSAGFSIDQQLNIETNTVYAITISSEATFRTGTAVSSLGQMQAISSVDPTITLDTNDPAYSLMLSDNLNSSSPVPEPGTLLLSLSGLGGLLRYRRRA